MQITFQFNADFEVCGKTVIAATEQQERLEMIAQRMALAAIAEPHVCKCNGKCQVSTRNMGNYNKAVITGYDRRTA